MAPRKAQKPRLGQIEKAERQQQQKQLPAYYTSTSGYMLYYAWQKPVNFKNSAYTSTNNNIRTYNTPLTANIWNIVHDKDKDTNIFYGMTEYDHKLYSLTFAKGGTSVIEQLLFTYSAATTSTLGACYAPICMGGPNGCTYGAFIIGGYAQNVIHVLEFNTTKSNIAYTYTVTYLPEVYGTEVIPKLASGFSQDFAVAYTRSNAVLSSFTVNLNTRSWTNRYDINFSPGSTGPSNGLGMIYYPPGKPIYSGDSDTSSNRVGLTDTSTAEIYVYKITESGNRLNFVWSRKVTMYSIGSYPYQLSTNAYNSIA